MKKVDQTNFVGLVFGIILGAILNTYLIFDISYYSILNKHSPLDFIWNLSIYLGEPISLSRVAVFIVAQMCLTILYCLFSSPYFISKRKIIPPSFVLIGATVPFLVIVGSFYFQFFQRAQVEDPLASTFVTTFLLFFFYLLVIFLMGPSLDRIVKIAIGAYYEEKQIEENAQMYSSNLEFETILEMLEDSTWLRDYASLFKIESYKDERKGEASYRFQKIGTDYYMCVSLFRRNKQNYLILTFYELYEDRFGREQRVNKEISNILAPQIKLIKKRLELSDAKTEAGILKKAIRFTTQIAKVPLERIAPYRFQVSVFVLNIIAIGALLYMTSVQVLDASLAIALYALILMVSLEAIRFKKAK